MIFRRALLREFTHAAAAVFVALFAVLITTVLIRLLGQAAGGRVPADAVLALIGFGALTELPIVLTLTVFIAVLLSLSRSYRDSEMVVWFASGVPLTAWIGPVLRFAVPLALVIAGVTLFLGPWAQLKNAEYRERLDSRDDTQRVAPGVFRESAGARRVFFVEVGAGEDGRVRNVFVSEQNEGKLTVIAAAEGFLQSDAQGNRYVVLEQGRRYDGEPGTPAYRVMSFERYQVQIEQPQSASALASKTRTKPTLELLHNPDARNLGELVGRIGMPLAALLLALLAIPLSFVNPRAGRTNNLLIAVLTYLVYSNAITICQAWVAQERMPFVLALLLPHLVVIVAMGLMFYTRLAVSPFWRARA
ncbi:LPS export ABC transporter permease LptF [Parazoarcus communis]|uniref:Lipopolysaccharide export system permease protein LptF n=1 Tax=Parazoarcus communis SWub3 = DSM 12120 TaxID=1121029 RepID=A0A323V0X3_9RHOO|nr:LPS export ABC transporter permease LptF [Parazoarcus communis]NMG70467.1 LPS export ABC transporter permease LptF [Parazoarcus communis SWub3 = DSM 12120]PZA17116.1 LPS export ABC transporter permease LptF [Azoarcus communis] [Parazoarcus communis SWub3 = DSM 12120]